MQLRRVRAKQKLRHTIVFPSTATNAFLLVRTITMDQKKSAKRSRSATPTKASAAGAGKSSGRLFFFSWPVTPVLTFPIGPLLPHNQPTTRRPLSPRPPRNARHPKRRKRRINLRIIIIMRRRLMAVVVCREEKPRGTYAFGLVVVAHNVPYAVIIIWSKRLLLPT